MTTTSTPSFSDLELRPEVQQSLNDVGYESPSPIQAQTIPLLLEGRDVVGQAQTGTGKTAAFALPILSNLDLASKPVQTLVLAPTRELAIQVAEAFQQYAKHLKGFHVLPVYGGQDYRGQIRALERGVHVVVGTPGRVMDHMRRGTLKLDQLTTLVLDEADEMLRMGFIDDVEWILDKIPKTRQIALFSATMPPQIRRIATRYLNNPEQVTVKTKTTTAPTIRQRCWRVRGTSKLDALTRILEAETFDAMLVFVRTKTSTVDLAEKLAARGFAVAPLNGDIPQNQRERTVEHLKKGKLDIIVATDVAARGLDVPRISHVINFDIPTDIESYVHRIGRTGRAGRPGDAILFVAPREQRLQYAIEKSTGKAIEQMDLPSNDMINNRRINRFKQRISDAIETEELSFYQDLIESYRSEHDDVPVETVAAALAHLTQGDTPFLFLSKKFSESKQQNNRGNAERSSERHADRADRGQRPPRRERSDSDSRAPGDAPRRSSAMRPVEKGMQRYRLAVGSDNDVKPGNIVGAIANEAGIDSQYIGQIHIDTDHSLIDLPEGMPKEIFRDLKKTRVCGVPMSITLASSDKPARRSNKSSSGKPSGDKRKSGKSDKGKSDKGKPGSHKTKGSKSGGKKSADGKDKKSDKKDIRKNAKKGAKKDDNKAVKQSGETESKTADS